MHHRILPPLVAVLVVNCTAPDLLYYKSAEFVGVGGTHAEFFVNLDVQPLKPESSGGLVLTSLSDRGQAAMIDATKAKSEFPDILAKPLKYKKQDNGLSVDDSKLKLGRQYLFSIYKYRFHPADRVIDVRIWTEVCNRDWRYDKVEGFETKIDTLNLAKLEATREASAGGKIDIGPPVIEEIVAGAFNVDVKSKQTLTRDIRVAIPPKHAFVDKRNASFFVSAPYQANDLYGQHTAKLSFGYAGPISSLLLFNAKLAGDQAEFSPALLKYPVHANSVDVAVNYEYTLRAVFDAGDEGGKKNNANTVKEDDDNASYRLVNALPTQLSPCQGIIAGNQAAKSITVASAQDLQSIVFGLKFGPNNEHLLRLYRAGHDTSSQFSRCLFFADAKGADEFASWLEADPPARVENRQAGTLLWRLGATDTTATPPTASKHQAQISAASPADIAGSSVDVVRYSPNGSQLAAPVPEYCK